MTTTTRLPLFLHCSFIPTVMVMFLNI
jgi:hypothetical protein